MGTIFRKNPRAKNRSSGCVSFGDHESPEVGDILSIIRYNDNKDLSITITKKMIASIKQCNGYKLMKYR